MKHDDKNTKELNVYRYDDEGDLVEVASGWHIDDVLGQAKDDGVKITKQQAGEVLSLLINKHDAEHGICWDTISHWIDYVVRNDKCNVAWDELNRDLTNPMRRVSEAKTLTKEVGYSG
mgnify:CR=1 FL=1